MKISAGIKIVITFIFMFHRRPIQIVVFFPVGLASLSRDLKKFLLDFEVPSDFWPSGKNTNI